MDFSRPKFVGKASLNKNKNGEGFFTAKYEDASVASTSKGAKKERIEGEESNEDEEKPYERKQRVV